jgi:restriction system protein
MPIPDFQSIMSPLLKFTGDNKEHSLRDAIESLAEYFKLTPDEQQELLASGSQAIFDNRVGWSKTHLLKAGLLESPRRSIFKITERGLMVLGDNPLQINMAYLRRFPEYIDFIKPSNGSSSNEITEKIDVFEATPQEILIASYLKIRTTLAQELLQKVKNCHPAFFERLVVDLLVKMGYGGSLKDAGNATRYSSDGGIDGIIREDKLGLDVIYIQAKRWESQNIGRPDIQSFVGALDGHRSTKGIFITTSKFAETAVEYVKTISKKVILIDGEQLANFMIDYNLGVSVVDIYEIKKIDNDFFGE